MRSEVWVIVLTVKIVTVLTVLVIGDSVTVTVVVDEATWTVKETNDEHASRFTDWGRSALPVAARA